jgi:uncharacterized membrane protein YqaE (UPF0057 family)
LKEIVKLKDKRMRVLEIVLAIAFPPIAVLIRWGMGKKFFINVFLTILGYIPGVIHALGLVAKPKSEPISA